MFDLLINSLISGIGIAIIAGPLGCFILWKKMSYLGDSISHAALLGVALSILLQIDIIYGAFALAGVYAIILSINYKYHSSDGIIGIMAHSGLALTLIILSLMRDFRIDLNAILFGNILTVTRSELITIYIAATACFVWLCMIWKPLLITTINTDIALSQNIKTNYINFQFMLMVSLVISMAIKIVGGLLITALLILPASTARSFSATPIQMAIFSSIIGCLSVIIGIITSYIADTPTGPTIVLVALTCFIISKFFRR
jgi:zinc transport system permease protein